MRAHLAAREHEGGDPLGKVERELGGRHRAERQTTDMRPFDAVLVEQVAQSTGRTRQREAAWRGRLVKPGDVRGQAHESVWQRGQLCGPRIDTGAQPGQEQQGLLVGGHAGQPNRMLDWFT
jgi:hypothetical protein